MITRIRDVRRARGLTLADVGRRCDPPTTAQTIGRLETGTRTVSLDWLERIAKALDVSSADLVTLPTQSDLPVAARLSADGARAAGSAETLLAPLPEPGMVAVRVDGAIGDYRTGDVLWCRRLASGDFASALNRDILAPRPAGRFAFGRLIGIEGERLLLLPLAHGARQMVIMPPPVWIGAVAALHRHY